MHSLSHHGPLACDRCIKTHNAKVIEANGWRLINDPGLWGASDPVVLILGQSKGNTQVRALADGEFTGVGIAKPRDRLARVLDRIGVDIDLKNFDKHFASNEKDLAFASLLRCSLSDSQGKSSGSPVMHAMDDPDANTWIVNCMDQWLSRPNPRLRLVVLFGLTTKYLSGVMDRLRNLHPHSFKAVNDVRQKQSALRGYLRSILLEFRKIITSVGSVQHRKKERCRPDMCFARFE